MTEGGPGVTGEGAPALPKKRSLFSKATIANVVAISEPVAFFSRAADVFEHNVEEERRRRERKLQRVERKRSSTSAEIKQSPPPEQKKRKVSGQDNAHEGYSSEGSGHEGESWRTRKESSHTTPGGKKSPRRAKVLIPQGSPPTSLSARYKRDLDAKKAEASQPAKGYISLSDSDSDDNAPTQVSKPNIHTIMLYDDDEPVKAAPRKAATPPPPPPEEDDLMSDEEFPELVRAAKERERLKAEAKLNAAQAKALAEKNRTSHGAVDSDLFEEATDDLDPTIEILITSKMEGMKPLLVRRKLSQRLKEVRYSWCDKQDIQRDPMGKPLKDVIFLSWRGKRLYDSTTCKALGLNMDSSGRLMAGDGVDSNGKLHFEAWTQEAFDYHEQRHAARLQREQEGSDGEEARERKRKEDAGPKHKLILKGKDMEPFKLVVRPHTTIEKLIAAFRGAHQVPAENDIYLYFDGDLLDPESTIADTDIGEDDDVDTVEVHIK